MRAYASIPALAVREKKINRELYVISFASDLRGESNHRPPAVGASNQTLESLTPAADAAMKFVIAAVSNIFHGIDKNQAVSLSGDGIVLYPPADPNGMLALQFSVIESDKGARDILGRVLGDDEVKRELKTLKKLTTLARGVSSEALSALMGSIAEAVVAHLGKDDILFSHGHSGVDFSAYGGIPTGRDYELGNRKIACTLRIYTRE